MGNSILNSGQNLIETAETTGLKDRITESINEVANFLSNSGVSQEYVQNVFSRLSQVENEQELHESIQREVAKVSMININEDDEEDALGRTSKDADGKSSKYAKPVKTKGDAKKSLEDKKKGRTVEHLAALFSGEELTDSFKRKASAIFEAAVNARVEEIQSELVRQSRDVFVEEINSVRYDLSEKLDDYLNYVVGEWMDENALAIDKGIHTEISESFMLGLRDLFESHYIDVPEHKVDMLHEMAQHTQELTAKLNNQIKENVKLKKKTVKANCGSIFESMCHGLADTEVEKFKSLARGLEYNTETEFSSKLNTLKESYFNNNSKPLQTLNEDMYSSSSNEEIVPQMNTRMNAYFNAVGRCADSIENNNNQS